LTDWEIVWVEHYTSHYSLTVKRLVRKKKVSCQNNKFVDAS